MIDYADRCVTCNTPMDLTCPKCSATPLPDPTPAEMDAAERRLAEGDGPATVDYRSGQFFTRGVTTVRREDRERLVAEWWNAAIDAAIATIHGIERVWGDQVDNEPEFRRFRAAAMAIEMHVRALRRTQESPK